MRATDDSLTVDQWVEVLSKEFEPREELLIPMLQHVQKEAGYLPKEAMAAVARYLRVSASKVFGVASFYAQFYFEPRGKHTVTVCRGTACHVRGSGKILQDLESHLGIEAGQTTDDLQFSLETVACFGSCALAPVVVLDETVYGRQTSDTAKASIGALDDSTQAHSSDEPGRVETRAAH